MANKIILVIDPGNSTGWCIATVNVETRSIVDIEAGTIPEGIQHLRWLQDFAVDIVVYETFQLYPGKAASLAWNTFYPVEVIGVIKYMFGRTTEMHGLQPSVKKFSGGFDDTWNELVAKRKAVGGDHGFRAITEHSRDTYLLLKYFIRNLLQ